MLLLILIHFEKLARLKWSLGYLEGQASESQRYLSYIMLDCRFNYGFDSP